MRRTTDLRRLFRELSHIVNKLRKRRLSLRSSFGLCRRNVRLIGYYGHAVSSIRGGILTLSRGKRDRRFWEEAREGDEGGQDSAREVSSKDGQVSRYSRKDGKVRSSNEEWTPSPGTSSKGVPSI